MCIPLRNPVQVPQAVSTITVAHELGHNHGSPVSYFIHNKLYTVIILDFSFQHDPSDDLECTPAGSAPKYIMYPSATNGGLREFSICSRRSIGRTLETRSSCFVPSKTTLNCSLCRKVLFCTTVIRCQKRVLSGM